MPPDLEIEKSPNTPEIIIPPFVEQDLQLGINKIDEQVKSFQPDFIIVLQRSGPVVFSAYAEHAKATETKLPPVIESHIGTEIRNRFYNESGGEETFDDAGGFELRNHQPEFYKWMETDIQVASVVEKLKVDIGEKGLVPQKILIVDDTKSVERQDLPGDTLDLIAPWIVKKALGKNVEIQTAVLLKNASYVRNILEATFGTGNLNEAETKFLRELKSGLIVEQGELVKIQSESQLEVLSHKIEAEYETNPLESLKSKFSLQFLLEFPQKLQEAFGRIGSK